MPPTGPQIDLPDLRVLPVNSLLVHEHHDVQRSEPLVQRLRAEQLLRNPPIVAPIPGDHRYVVLDGANRVTALTLMGIPHIVAQVVDYEDPELVLDTWYHLVSEMPRADFHAAVDSLAGISVAGCDLIGARARLARRDALAYLIYPNADVFVLQGEGDIHVRTALLNDVVDIYRDRGRIYRANTDQLENLLPYFDAVTVLVVFPRYEPAEIVELTREGAKLPAGITRHIIPRRALRVNVPLELLGSSGSLAEKNRHLRDWLKEKMAGKQARLYQESTFLFDE